MSHLSISEETRITDRVTESIVTKHLQLTCPKCGDIYKRFILYETKTLKSICLSCGAELYWNE